jgi:hypothetical protein
MYHPGKVMEVLRPTDKEVVSADESVQAILNMWDENILTMSVSPELADKIKKGQTVLVDYRPTKEFEAPIPAHNIIKIITAKKAESVWNAYEEMKERVKNRKNPPKPRMIEQQSYIG